MTIALIVDTETHAAVEPILIEYGQAMTELRDDGVWMGDVRVQRFNPMVPIQYGAMATHGFTNEDVQAFPPVTTFEYEAPDYLIAHNVDFDAGVVKDTTSKRICTLALSRATWPDLDSHRLMAILYYLSPSKAKELHHAAHGVEADITACLYVLAAIVEIRKPASWNDLWQMSEQDRIPTKINFGKHKGTLIKDIEASYCKWYAGTSDTDPYLIQAMQKAGKI